MNHQPGRFIVLDDTLDIFTTFDFSLGNVNNLTEKNETMPV